MDITIEKIKDTAEYYKMLYNSGGCTREEAKKYIQPYLDLVNKKSIEIALKYNQKPKKINFISYIR